jgi:hypothetical protein
VGEHDEYCRAIETYLCRKNEGHLIRIVGPAFEQVCGWSNRGVPLKVAYRGIDRYFERYYAKGPRRRPVRVEFCEADVLDVFDEWKRAVGVLVAREDGADADADADASEDAGSRRRGSLKAHVGRARLKLAALPGGDERLRTAIAPILQELDAMAAVAAFRGDTRRTAEERLRGLDAMMMDATIAHTEPTALQALQQQADEELAPFRDRMPETAYADARRACLQRLLRDQLRLPVLTFEP